MALLAELNAQVALYNADKPEPDQVTPFDETAEAWPQINKLAYWMATGSGKTLLMHANILQYQHTLEKHGRRRELNRILLLTPNEGLSQQHLREFEAAGIEAELFNKDGRGLFTGHAVEILEITKLRDEMGEKTVAIDAFEGNNLVLVDEGHRGASGGEEGAWMRFRNALCEKGFSFEYSATFGQAVKGKPKLTEVYAKSTLFDYSYRYFYGDGFGKDYQILNLDEGHAGEPPGAVSGRLPAVVLPAAAALPRARGAFRPFNIEKPLWIFVGGSVTATLAKKDASDIVEILQFLARYVADRADSIQRIERVLNQGLVTATGRNLFAGGFAYLNTCGLTPAQVFDETLAVLFNAPGGGQLYVENLKGAAGEVALRLGAENEAFGVINVGDDAKLVKLCEEKRPRVARESEFSGSLFHEINSRTPGERADRLEEVHRGLEQLAGQHHGPDERRQGRGRADHPALRPWGAPQGLRLSLKRSGKTQLPEGVDRPKHISVLETLGIFGIHADYMAQFRDFLEEEGPAHQRRPHRVPTAGHQEPRHAEAQDDPPQEDDQRRQHRVRRCVPQAGAGADRAKPARSRSWSRRTQYLQKNQVVLNWYPKIQAMKSGGLAGGDGEAAPNQAHLTAEHIAFLDLDRLYFELERFKAERGWYNLNLTRARIEELLADQSWYQLLIPAEELAFDSFERVRQWEEIALALLKKYTERYYTFRKREWELPHLEYRDLEGDDPNFLG